jgi:hypothetical protein
MNDITKMLFDLMPTREERIRDIAKDVQASYVKTLDNFFSGVVKIFPDVDLEDLIIELNARAKILAEVNAANQCDFQDEVADSIGKVLLEAMIKKRGIH